MRTSTKPVANTAGGGVVAARERAREARLALDLAEAEIAAAEAAAAAQEAQSRVLALRNEGGATDTPADTGIASPNNIAFEGITIDNEATTDSEISADPEPGDDVAGEAEVTTDGDGSTDRPRARRWGLARVARWRGSALWILAPIVVIAVVTAMVWWGVDQRLGHRDDIAHRDDRNAVVALATTGVERMLSIDQKSVDADIKNILADSTGEWRQDFSQRSGSFAKVVRDANVSTAGKVSVAGVERRGPDGSYQVLVTAKSKVTNAAGAQEEPRNWRLRVTVADTSDGYKISKMEFVA